MLVKNDIYMH